MSIPTHRIPGYNPTPSAPGIGNNIATPRMQVRQAVSARSTFRPVQTSLYQNPSPAKPRTSAVVGKYANQHNAIMHNAKLRRQQLHQKHQQRLGKLHPRPNAAPPPARPNNNEHWAPLAQSNAQRPNASTGSSYANPLEEFEQADLAALQDMNSLLQGYQHTGQANKNNANFVAAQNIPSPPTNIPEALQISPAERRRIQQLQTPNIQPQISAEDAAAINRINAVQTPGTAPVTPDANPVHNFNEFFDRVEKGIVFGNNNTEITADKYLDRAMRDIMNHPEHGIRKPRSKLTSKEVEWVLENTRQRLKKTAEKTNFMTPALEMAIAKVENEIRKNRVLPTNF